MRRRLRANRRKNRRRQILLARSRHHTVRPARTYLAFCFCSSMICWASAASARSWRAIRSSSTTLLSPCSAASARACRVRSEGDGREPTLHMRRRYCPRRKERSTLAHAVQSRAITDDPAAKMEVKGSRGGRPSSGVPRAVRTAAQSQCPFASASRPQICNGNGGVKSEASSRHERMAPRREHEQRQAGKCTQHPNASVVQVSVCCKSSYAWGYPIPGSVARNSLTVFCVPVLDLLELSPELLVLQHGSAERLGVAVHCCHQVVLVRDLALQLGNLRSPGGEGNRPSRKLS